MKKILSKNFLKEITSKLSSIFDEQTLQKVARETKFAQRSTNRLRFKEFLIMITLYTASISFLSLSGMCDILNQMNKKINLSYQALSAKLHLNSIVLFQKRVFGMILKIASNLCCSPVEQNFFDRFGRILIEDSTQGRLHNKLSDKFKGCGGSAGKSAWKIDLIWEAKTKKIVDIDLEAGHINDASLGKRITNHMKEGDLIIRDLGYFCLQTFQMIENVGAFFISRFKKGVMVRLQRNGKSIDLPKYLLKRFKNCSKVDIVVYIGKEQYKTRLIAYRVPDDVFAQRQRRLKNTCRKKGTTAKKKDTEWNRFTFFITNLSEKNCSTELIGTIYSLRWEIERALQTHRNLPMNRNR